MTIQSGKSIMCQPVNGYLTRNAHISPNGSFRDDHAHWASLNERSSTSEYKESAARAFRKDFSGDELCREEIELVRHSHRLSDGERRRRALVTFAEAPVRNGDTLVTIALKYGCRVSELKQLNRLIRDQDIYGLRTVRVPVKRYGIVEELIKAEMTEEQSNVNLGVAEIGSSESSDTEMDEEEDTEEAASSSCRQPLLHNTDSTDTKGMSRQARRALKHLHAVDSNVRTVVSAVASSRTFDDSVSIPAAVIHLRRQESVPLWTRIRWWAIVIGIAFIVLPLAFLVYVKYLKS